MVNCNEFAIILLKYGRWENIPNFDQKLNIICCVADIYGMI